MYGLFDKCVLFLFCLLSFPFGKISPPCVLACLLAIAVSAGLSVCSSFVCRAALLAYALLLFFFPQAGIFLPLLAYDAFSWADGGHDRAPDRTYVGTDAGRTQKHSFLTLPADWFAPLCLGASLLFLLFLRKNFGFRHAFLPYRFQLLLLLLGCLLAVLLRRKTDTQLCLRRQLLRTKDDDTELQLLLEERNRSLLEKQDNEIYTATLRERNRIAREIHDNVGHLLTRAILMVGALKTICRDPASGEPLDQLKDTLDHAMDSIRSSVHDLHDSSVNLEDSLRTMAREFSSCPVSVQYRMSPNLAREIKYSLIAIAREALVNISRHSNATAASITAIEHPGFYQFIIQDNGSIRSTDPMPVGLPAQGSDSIRNSLPAQDGDSIHNALPSPDGGPPLRGKLTPQSRIGNSPGTDLPGRSTAAPAAGLSQASGIGLENIRARVSALNGNLQIQSSGGFRIYITIPRVPCN